MRPIGSHRIQGIPPTIFSEMSALAVSTGSVNLGQGFPDADGPAPVLERAVEALRGGANQYAPGRGIPALRQAIAAHQARHYGLQVDPEREVVVTTGCTEAVAAALLALVDAGDEVVVLDPLYDSYAAMVQFAGGVLRPVTLRAPGFRLDVEALRAAVGPRTRVLLLNTPHNPTGTVLTRAETAAVADVAREHDLVVVTDEVYEHLVFADGTDRAHLPIATLPGMWERTLTLSSIGKSYSLTGWKVGWATGPAPLVDAVLAAKQWLTFTSGSPLQPAAALALDEHPGFPGELAADLRVRRDLLLAGLAAAGLPGPTPESTYFATTDVAHLGWDDASAFCRALPDRAGVVAVPSQVLHHDPDGPGRHHVRWAFCKDAAVIEDGVARLAAADLSA